MTPQTLGDAMRLIGTFLDAPQPASAPPAHLVARADLARTYMEWLAAGAPDHGTPSGPVAAHQDHGLAFHSRMTDPDTSDTAAAVVEDREGGHTVVREGTHKARLLVAYGRASRTDRPYLTDAQAAEAAGLGTGGWKRCSDLRTGGFVRQVGETQGEMGTPVMTCELTTKGRQRWSELDMHAPRDPGPANDNVKLF